MNPTIKLIGILTADIEHVEALCGVRRTIVTQQAILKGEGFVVVGDVSVPILFSDYGWHENILLMRAGETILVECEVGDYGVLIVTRVLSTQFDNFRRHV